MRELLEFTGGLAFLLSVIAAIFIGFAAVGMVVFKVILALAGWLF